LLRVSSLATAARRPNTSPESLAAGLDALRALIQSYMRRATVLLDVSRITTGKLVLSPQPLDLTEVVQRLAAEAEPIARHVGSELRLSISHGVRGSWDMLAVEQVVENLISNALKYGHGKPVEVALSLEGGRARLVVRDNGLGISEEDRKRIFERFERAVTGSAGGFGIGLWLVQQLVKAMQGNIAVESEVGAGSTFVVTLPLASTNQHGAGKDAQ
jgi:two-component system OmpR family sensor kinase